MNEFEVGQGFEEFLPQLGLVGTSGRLLVYTDGSCKVWARNPGQQGQGGWCFVVVGHDNTLLVVSGAVANTTNNRMELTAVMEAIKYCKSHKLQIVTDSVYVANGLKEWLATWVRRMWRTTKGGEVQNRDIWQKLVELRQGRDILIKWEKGHRGNLLNDIADEMAKERTKDLLQWKVEVWEKGCWHGWSKPKESNSAN